MKPIGYTENDTVPKKTAIISLTEKGRIISEKIAVFSENEDFRRYCFYKHTDEKAADFTKLPQLITDIFAEYDRIIFVCACGIAVRVISPHIVSKLTDPAVIVIDDSGRFVIPILSGHIGGANAYAEKISEKLGAQAVITTATDTGKKFSPDSFAAANKLIIADMRSAKEISAASADGEKIGFVCDYDCKNIPPQISVGTNCRTGIVVSDDVNIKPFEVTMNLVPKNIVIGIGCRSGIFAEMIEKTVKKIFSENGIDTERICAAASIDIKADEPGLTDFCRRRKIPLFTYSAKELMMEKGIFSSSEFVLKITGTDNVCERSAAKHGKLIIRKSVYEGVTVAAAETEFTIDFERKQQ